MWILGAIVVVDIGAVCLVLGVVVVALWCWYWDLLLLVLGALVQ